jgi:2'-5' RNA ligase
MFVALELPPDRRAELAAWRDRALAGRGELRPVASEALHVTLCFLGWQAEVDAPRIASTAFEAAGGCATPRLAAVGLTPVPPRRPRLFALDLDDEGGAAAALQSAVADALADAGHYEPETRPFWPHVTLARVRRGACLGAFEGQPAPGTRFAASELTLYRSTLRPQGALYEPLAGTRLTAG